MVSNKQNQASHSGSDQTQSSLSRFARIPLVQFSIAFALNVYSRVKTSNKLLTTSMDKVEAFLLVGLQLVQQLTTRYEKQVQFVDSYGKVILDKLESTAPQLTTFEPQNTLNNVSNRLNGLRSSVNERVNVVRAFDLSKTVSSGIKSVDHLVDEYLPGSENEQSSISNVDNNLMTQVNGVFHKLRRRSMKKVQNIQRLVY